MLGDLSSLPFQNYLIIEPIVKFEKNKTKQKIDSLFHGVTRGWDSRRPTAQDRAALTVWCGKAGMALAHTI